MRNLLKLICEQMVFNKFHASGTAQINDFLTASFEHSKVKTLSGIIRVKAGLLAPSSTRQRWGGFRGRCCPSTESGTYLRLHYTWMIFEWAPPDYSRQHSMINSGEVVWPAADVAMALTRWLIKTEIYFSQLGRLQVWDEGARVGSGGPTLASCRWLTSYCVLLWWKEARGLSDLFS